MKKLISLALALMLVLSLSTVAFAAEGDTTESTPSYTEKLDKSTTFTKAYDITNGTAPAETFDFNIAFVSYKDNENTTKDVTVYPMVTLGDAVFNENLSADGTASVSVEIRDYENVALGVYTYEITEVVPSTKTAGTTYNTQPIYLVVTILNNETNANHYVAAIHYETVAGTKTGEITNSYNAGQLSVTKKITGNMADMDKKFPFTVVFTPAAGTAFNTNVQIINDADSTKREYEATENENGTYTITFELGHDETATFTNIPVGTAYTVSEEAGNYTSTHTTQADGSITGGDVDADVWTNTLTSEIDTGITMDSMPYVLLLAVAAVGLVVMFTKKRMMREF